MKSYLCIDIGGTSIKYGVYDKFGKKQRIFDPRATMQTERGSEIIDTVKDIVSFIKNDYKLDGVCISSAGVVNPNKGEIVYSGYTIPNYTGTKIKEIIEQEFGILCEVENDVNCACLGEYWIGAGKGHSSIVCLTIGTGIGGAIIVNGNLLNGNSYTAGEIGYINILGERFQDIASTTSLVKRVQDRMVHEKGIQEKDINGREIFNLAKQGEKICVEEIDKMIHYLGIGVSNLIYILNPEVVILGGGIMAQKEYLEEKINLSVKSNFINDIFFKTKIKFAEQENEAGMVGALYNFLKKHRL